MIRINLLPVRAAQKKERLRSQLSVLLLCVILVCAVCGALYVQKMFAIDGLKNEIVTLDKKNADLKKTLGEVANYEKKKKDLEQKLAVLNRLEEGRSGPVRLLDELSNSLPAMPDKLWLTQFAEKSGGIEIQGYGDSEKTVAKFMQNLEASKYYKEIELTVTEQAKLGESKLQKFTLKCKKESPTSKPSSKP